MEYKLVLKSFGYGIYSLEFPSECSLESTNDIQEFIHSELQWIECLEVISDYGNDKRWFIIGQSGHTPTKYEISLIDSLDWDSIRNSIDNRGSQKFSNRFTLLECYRMDMIKKSIS